MEVRKYMLQLQITIPEFFIENDLLNTTKELF